METNEIVAAEDQIPVEKAQVFDGEVELAEDNELTTRDESSVGSYLLLGLAVTGAVYLSKTAWSYVIKPGVGRIREFIEARKAKKNEENDQSVKVEVESETTEE